MACCTTTHTHIRGNKYRHCFTSHEAFKFETKNRKSLHETQYFPSFLDCDINERPSAGAHVMFHIFMGSSKSHYLFKGIG